MPSNRLHFTDAMRTFAILMMLQGHFVYEMLADAFRDDNNPVYATWKYFRGVTAPVFFTVSGFIFTYLLIRNPQYGWANPRVKKGIRRALYIIMWGYLLRLNVWMLFKGEITNSSIAVDVLHCIGFSLLYIITIYVVAGKHYKTGLPIVMLATGIVVFALNPLYEKYPVEFIPRFAANYFTNYYGSVFTLIPWIGYATLGSFLGILFYRYKETKNFLNKAVLILAPMGLFLIFVSSPLFELLSGWTGINLFLRISQNNYLFMRFGDVLMFFSVFILIRKYLEHHVIEVLGKKTLTIYILHFIVLYGSWIGWGIVRAYKHALDPFETIFSVLVFILGICVFTYYFEKEALTAWIKNSKPYRLIFVQIPRFVLRKLKSTVQTRY